MNAHEDAGHDDGKPGGADVAEPHIGPHQPRTRAARKGQAGHAAHLPDPADQALDLRR